MRSRGFSRAERSEGALGMTEESRNAKTRAIRDRLSPFRRRSWFVDGANLTKRPVSP
jgi:hypothetical protein